MSSIKEHMHELWSQIDIKATFLCPHCGHPASAWVKVSRDEEETIEEVECFNPDEEAHQWTVVIRSSDNGYTASVVEEPFLDIHLEVDDRWQEEWDEPYPEPGAYGIFLEAMREWLQNVNDIGAPEGYSSRNRMLFGTLYSIAEAYFSDAIIGSALSNSEILHKLLKVTELGLTGKQIKLETVLEKPDIVEEMIRSSLQGISYHNLRVVNTISLKAFDRSILPQDDVERRILLLSVQKRHDCIHRNGLNIDGAKHVDITPQYLKKVGKSFEGMAFSLEEAIRAAQVKRFFTRVGADG